MLKLVTAVFLITLLAIESKSRHVTNKSHVDSDCDNKNLHLYKVYKIDSINTWYLIYAKRNDSLYKIVSKKESFENCKRIKINGEYNFRLVSWFPSDAPKNLNISPRNIPHLAGYGFDDSTTIILERDSINDLMYGQNIKGLCFIKE